MYVASLCHSHYVDVFTVNKVHSALVHRYNALLCVHNVGLFIWLCRVRCWVWSTQSSIPSSTEWVPPQLPSPSRLTLSLSPSRRRAGTTSGPPEWSMTWRETISLIMYVGRPDYRVIPLLLWGIKPLRISVCEPSVKVPINDRLIFTCYWIIKVFFFKVSYLFYSSLYFVLSLSFLVWAKVQSWLYHGLSGAHQPRSLW